jgi:hypothetical protein
MVVQLGRDLVLRETFLLEQLTAFRLLSNNIFTGYVRYVELSCLEEPCHQQDYRPVKAGPLSAKFARFYREAAGLAR